MKNRNPYNIGDDIEVKAWWLPDNRIVLCRVIEANPPDWHQPPQVFVTVTPLLVSRVNGARVPHGHSRFLDVEKHVVNPRPIREEAP